MFEEVKNAIAAPFSDEAANKTKPGMIAAVYVVLAVLLTR